MVEWCARRGSKLSRAAKDVSRECGNASATGIAFGDLIDGLSQLSSLKNSGENKSSDHCNRRDSESHRPSGGIGKGEESEKSTDTCGPSKNHHLPGAL